MIYLVYTGPCTYDPAQIGWAEAEIGYTGQHPVKTAEDYVRRLGFRCRLAYVSCNGRVWYDGRP